MSAAPKSATPTNSLTRRVRVLDATSDLHHHRQYERPEPRTLAEEPLQVHSNLLLDQPRVGAFFDARPLDRRADQRRNLLEQRFRSGIHHETARNHVRRLFERARLPADRADRYHEAVTR